MDELTAHIWKEVLWHMLFVDDVVLLDELRDGVITKFERWQEAFRIQEFWNKLDKGRIYEL